jgi:hypothetical protein
MTKGHRTKDTYPVYTECPIPLVRDFDVAWKGRFNTRAAALQAAMQLFIEKHKEA